MSSALVWAEAAVLGLVQGLTEFLPVSSSAHLRIIGPLLPSGGDPGAAFTAITQLGTELAVLIYFRKDVLRMLVAWFASLPVIGSRRPGEALHPDAKLAWLVILGGRRGILNQALMSTGLIDEPLRILERDIILPGSETKWWFTCSALPNHAIDNSENSFVFHWDQA